MGTGTEIGRVRGLGSAKGGASHWAVERTVSLATLPLFVWFAVSLLRLPDLGHATVVNWLASPLNAVLMLLLVATTFVHLKQGMQVVLDDYVHNEGTRVLSNVALLFLSVAGGVAAAFAVLQIAFRGTAS
jgi:succinate dehydrogenase / fumarate reductase membrane anchor subunit